MAALISWLCRADHAVQGSSEHVSMITINESKWALCLRGGDSQHEWRSIEPAPVESLRLYRNVPSEVSAVALER